MINTTRANCGNFHDFQSRRNMQTYLPASFCEKNRQESLCCLVVIFYRQFLSIYRQLSSMFTASGSYRFITLSDGEILPRVRVLPSHLSDKFSVLTSSCLWRFCPAKSIAPLVGHFTALRLAHRLLYYRIASGYFKITDRTL